MINKPDRFKVKAVGEKHTHRHNKRGGADGGGGEKRMRRDEDEGKQQRHYWQQITKENTERFSPRLPGVGSGR